MTEAKRDAHRSVDFLTLDFSISQTSSTNTARIGMTDEHLVDAFSTNSLYKYTMSRFS